MTDVEMILDRVDKIADVIREQASESERLGHLAPPVVQALRDADLFRVLVPTALGGSGLTIPEAIAVIERVAENDASTGWAFAILAGGPLFARSFAPDAFAAVCDPELGLAAGSLNPVATRAEVVDGGYLFSGRATYLSGSSHANWVMAAGIVTKAGEPLIVDGGIEIRVGLDPDRSGPIARHVARHGDARHGQQRLRIQRRDGRDRLDVRTVSAAPGDRG